MKIKNSIYPDFLIIGAQKSGTTWLWEMLNQHPETDLPQKKEHHFFSKTHKYNTGFEQYLKIFKNISPFKITGEGSTSYLYDRVRKNIHMEYKNVKIDKNLPSIPELIIKEMPHIKIVIILRDPVKRAISAYYHFMKARNYSPLEKFGNVINKYPNRLIIEFGHYAKYIKLWKKYVTKENMRIYILEEDIKKNPDILLKDIHYFLNINDKFVPQNFKDAIHKKMNWVFLLLNYYSISPNGKLNNLIKRLHLKNITDKMAFLILPKIKQSEIDLLRHTYLDEKDELESIIGRSLNCWNYNYPN